MTGTGTSCQEWPSHRSEKGEPLLLPISQTLAGEMAAAPTTVAYRPSFAP